MNPSVAVAFMTKMKLIFETDADGKPQPDTFLAFQNGEFPVSKDTFFFLQPAKHGLGPNETAQWMMNFDKTFNFVAAVDDIITRTADELDGVYYETLKKCLPAASNRTAEQENRYAAALAYLQQTVPGDDGTPLLLLDNYQHYEDAYQEAVSTYKNSQIAAESATGPGAETIQQAWQQTRAQLQHACDVALLNWETKGHRSGVETNLATFTSLAGSSPLKTIADLQSDFELFGKATALDPAANEINYLPTQFSPINFYDETVPWQTLSLDKAEINSLLQRAPPQLTSLFSLDTDSDIEHLTVDYTVVSILRNWFHYPDFILQRFWKLAPDMPPLADGLGGGRLPAYPDKLVFVRNVRLTAPKTAPAPPPPTRLSALLFAEVQPSAAEALQSKAAAFQVQEQQTQRLLTTFRLQQAEVAAPTSLSLAARPLALRMALAPSAVQLLTEKHDAAAALEPAAPPALVAASRPPASLPLLMRSGILRAPLLAPPERPDTGIIKLNHNFISDLVPVDNAAPVLETTVQPDMELLAFVCRKLPQCPNPDPSLPWS